MTKKSDKGPTKGPVKQSAQRSARQQQLFDNLLKMTYEFVKGRRYAPQSKLSLIERLRIHEDHFAIFDQVLKDLKESGKLSLSGDKYLPAEVAKNQGMHTVVGSLKVHPRGFGFVEPSNESESDIFIPKPFMNNAIDGDIVEVLVSEVVSEKGPEGKILRTISRKRTRIVASVRSLHKEHALAYCAMLGFDHQVIVEALPGQPPLLVGDRLLLDVIEWGSKGASTRARVAERLGTIDDPSSDIRVSILENDIRMEFPRKALAEAHAYGEKVQRKDLEGRLDLRDLECFTIDPETAKDFDDALSLSEEEDHFLLGVHIADVSHYVQPGSAMDAEAIERCNSTYFPGTCVPMLPPALADNLCSLREGVIRLTITVFMRIDKHGDLLSWDIQRSFIRSRKRLSYEQAKAIIDGTLKSSYRPHLARMVALCQLLKKKRAARGSVELLVPELQIQVDPNGKATGIRLVEYDISHQLVEEFMLKANEVVAMHLSKMGKNVSFRVHEEPAKESMREFAALATAFGYKLPSEPSSADIQQLFQEIEGKPFQQHLAICYIRSMRLACYSSENIGHFGLSLGHYCHFTSPIRRYADLIVHRLLFGENIERNGFLLARKGACLPSKSYVCCKSI